MRMEIEAHHVKPPVCATRPPYREGRVGKAVKVYTCAQESKYLLVTKIPSIGAHNDLVKLFALYGEIDEHKMLDEYPGDEFDETILIKFAKIPNARIAKIKMDNYNFMGQNLHVCYAPEYESVDDLREKLDERRQAVLEKCQKYDAIKFGTIEWDAMNKIEPYKRVGFKNKPRPDRKEKKWPAKSEQASQSSERGVIYPQLPDNWIRPSSLTASSSLDRTSDEIESKLKRTIPHQQPVIFKKKRKTIQL